MAMEKSNTMFAEMQETGRLDDEAVIDWRAWRALLASQAKFLLMITVAGGALAGGIALLIPNMYTAQALILSPTKPQSLSAALMGQLGGLSGALAPALGIKDPAELYITMLKSRWMMDQVLDQCHLQQVYDKDTKEAARRKLRDRVSIASGRDSTIRISADDQDPNRAAAIANAYVSALQKLTDRLATTESAQRRLVFEREVESQKKLLADAENALRETQNRTGVVEASGQAQVIIASVAQLRAQIAINEVGLQRLKTGATAQNPEVIKLETELTSMRSQLSKLEAGSARQRVGDPFVPVANVPQAGLDYVRALREVKYHEVLFEALSKQYEAARIDEAKEAPVVQVVDVAIPPERRSAPPRIWITTGGAVLGTLIACVIVRIRAGAAGQATT